MDILIKIYLIKDNTKVQLITKHTVQTVKESSVMDQIIFVISKL